MNTESAHHHPTNALRPTPASTMNDRYAQRLGLLRVGSQGTARIRQSRDRAHRPTMT
jgi:hypothetical protein